MVMRGDGFVSEVVWLVSSDGRIYIAFNGE